MRSISTIVFLSSCTSHCFHILVFFCLADLLGGKNRHPSPDGRFLVPNMPQRFSKWQQLPPSMQRNKKGGEGGDIKPSHYIDSW